MPRLDVTKPNGSQQHPAGELITVDKEERTALKALRVKRELTGKELARLVGVTAATISNLETGRSKQIRKIVYAKIRRALKATETRASNAEMDEFFRMLVEEAIDLDADQAATAISIIKTLKKPR